MARLSKDELDPAPGATHREAAVIFKEAALAARHNAREMREGAKVSYRNSRRFEALASQSFPPSANQITPLEYTIMARQDRAAARDMSDRAKEFNRLARSHRIDSWKHTVIGGMHTWAAKAGFSFPGIEK
ncbi:MAG TPA: hypothetical protein VIF12_02505 [Micavibrio sp.]